MSNVFVDTNLKKENVGLREAILENPLKNGFLSVWEFRRYPDFLHERWMDV
jgi:hypothetical protein